MVAWAIGHTDRFKTVICGAPLTNMTSSYGAGDIGYIFGPNQFGGTPVDRHDWFVERSPLTYLHNAKTPTLIVHGEADLRCPISQGEELFTALKTAGCEVEFARYPGGGHLFPWAGPAPLRLDFFQRCLDWFKEHL
jgi:dipeptidyl aminopeptidase/acylaminoacyl peptidase